MKLATLSPYGIGVVTPDGSGVVPVQSRPMAEVLEHWEGLHRQLASLLQTRTPVPIDSVRLGPPVPHPSKIWAAAGNYRRGSGDLSQGAGRGAARTTDPDELLHEIFLKPPSALVGPGAKVIIPEKADTIFPELELCVVMGRRCKDLKLDEVWDAVFGYTIILDMTARGYGSGSLVATRNVRKGFDTFAPTGPWIVTRDEIANPEALQMKLWVNGELRQSAKTDGMINGITRLVSYLSSVTEFLPGDLIATGNPDAPEFQQKIQPGNELKAEIEGIGSMTLTVAAAA
ncbi:MAG TPA: fumarylacetoacetate hydrolase family protein [Chloroflexota bacterium]|nr:fumarylacetoacetate hydrolase family protein [Chloroflexota bacterium]